MTREVLCSMSEERFSYLVQFAQRHNLSLGDALLRALRLTQTIEHLPEAHWQTDLALRQLARRERRKSKV